MNSEPPSLPPQPPKKPITLPLVLAFVPSVIVLLLITFSPSKNHMVACCVLLGLLNLVINAGLGCTALLSDLNVH